ncbi:MAG: DUF4230 domain-containing protein [Winogradskyella sp.]|nr:DUF4230 domain-containing protein [Winogradskyella sp.]NNC45734.1 DUF4230 domain-containing protein [Winogradskyella sp.]
MRKFLFGIILTLAVVLLFKYCTRQPTIVVKESSVLIQEQIKNVGKLVVTEGHFSEVFNYEDSKDIFGSYLTADKKALVVVNADVTVSYDLSKLTYNADEVKKILTITNIPEEEISIYPELVYYDVQADFLNPFEAKDYNTIKDRVKENLIEKINQSNLKTNAQNRLISELSKFFILTNTLGWELKYNTQVVESTDELKKLVL